jgi:hypothetical protein
VIKNADLPAGGVDGGDEIVGVRALVGVRDAAGVLGNAFVVCERRQYFRVPEARRTQDQPLGLEDGDTAFPETPGLDLQQCHHTGSLGFETLEGEPVHPSPPRIPSLVMRARRVDMNRRTSFEIRLYSAAASVAGRTDT